jgi:transposase
MKNHPPTDPWNALGYYMGLDWSKDHHDIVVVDPQGDILLEMTFDDNAKGWHRLRRRLDERVGADYTQIGAAVETSRGPAVERLLELGCTVFPVHPKAAQRYRDRKAPSGVKNDRLDAWSLGDALRTDGRQWRVLQEEDPRVQELRLICRDEISLIEQQTALINQLQEALHEYYPAALEAFTDWTRPSAWAFVERFPTPQALGKAGKRRWEKFLHANKLYCPQTYPHRLEIFTHAEEFCGAKAVTRAKSLLAVSLAGQLRLLGKQLAVYRQRIQELFDQHPDHGLFDSLPGAGPKLAPRLLCESGGSDGPFEDVQGMQCMAGTAPVSFQSGQMKRVRFRWACNKHFRAAVHLWANLSRTKCAWAEAYYRKKRQEGKSHSCALRCLGQRWLKILFRMVRTGRPYDEALHMRNQVAHGSWVIELVQQKA